MFARAENKLHAGVCQTALYVTQNYVCGHFRQAFRNTLYFFVSSDTESIPTDPIALYKNFINGQENTCIG